MTEEKIVERVVTEISREVDNATPDDIFICRHHCHAAARAVVALLGPAPLEWGPVPLAQDCWTAGEYYIDSMPPANHSDLYICGIDRLRLYSGDDYRTARAAAEAHHRAAWWARTMAGRGG